MTISHPRRLSDLDLPAIMEDTLVCKGVMRGHTGAVTAIAAPRHNSDMIVSSSRDKSVIVWDLPKDSALSGVDPSTSTYGVPRRRLTGHSHFVQDVVLSNDGMFALSASWDGELRLWELATGETAFRFVGHTKEVLAVAFSVDNRLIVSTSRDRSIKLWNIIGMCKHSIEEVDDEYNSWVSCVRFNPNSLSPMIVCGCLDGAVEVWNLTNRKLTNTLEGHVGYVNAVAVSPNGALCASGGKDEVTLLWDLAEGKMLCSLDAGATVHCICFSPTREWLCAATQDSVRIWDLRSKSIVQDLMPEVKAIEKMVYCTSLCWSSDGSTLFAGYTDGHIRVWGFSPH